MHGFLDKMHDALEAEKTRQQSLPKPTRKDESLRQMWEWKMLERAKNLLSNLRTEQINLEALFKLSEEYEAAQNRPA